ncbi:hypothetical protein SLA2020_529080 [Shorea laevis]
MGKSESQHSGQRRESRWIPPEAGQRKMNVDGALNEHRRVWDGALIQNEQGQVVAAMACKGNGFLPAVVVEAYSLRKVLGWMAELGCGGVEVVCDAACVVSGVSATDRSGLSELEMNFENCRILLSSLEECSLWHVRIEGDSVAHELAKRALTNDDGEYWVEKKLCQVILCNL